MQVQVFAVMSAVFFAGAASMPEARWLVLLGVLFLIAAIDQSNQYLAEKIIRAMEEK